MTGNFRFAKLSIRGFRGIRELDLDLPVNKPLHIIGANNSGKSTVLRALALILRGGGFHQFVPEEFDFFHDATGVVFTEFTVTLHLAADDEKELPAVQGVGNPIRVHAVEVRGSTDAKGKLNHRRVLLDRDGDAILISDRTPLKGAIKDEFKGTGLGYRRFYPRIDDIRQYMPDVWLLTPQNLYRSLYEWKTGPLQRLSGMLANKFLSTPWEFEFGGKNRKMPDALVKAYEFFRASVEAFPFWQNDLKPKLEDTLSRYVGGQARVALRPDVQEIEDWLAQQLVASFAAEGTGAAIPLQNMGDGWQTLVRLAALDVLSQYPEQVSERVLLLMEEPETYLHPHLCRRMRTVLGELAQQGWTVLTATHGPELISFAQPQLIVKLWRKGDTVSKGVFDTGLTPDALKFQEKLDELGNHEMLFANKIVLCEGKGDCWAIRSGLGKLSADLDLDANSISVVATGSVGNLPDYAAMAKQLGIPWCAVSDEDKKPGEPVNPVTEGIRRKVVDLLSPTDLSAIWPGDLEACLGTPAGQKATPEWQAKHTDPKPLADMQAEHPNFIATCSSVEAWLRA